MFVDDGPPGPGTGTGAVDNEDDGPPELKVGTGPAIMEVELPEPDDGATPGND